MIAARLTRLVGDDEGTLGRLELPGWWCWSLELPWRDNRTNCSRIVAGRYELVWVTPRRAFSGFRELYLVRAVPGRSGILVHPGTFAGDVEKRYRADSWGCLLLGMQRGALAGQRSLFNSRRAVRELHELAQRRPVQLTIEEVGHA